MPLKKGKSAATRQSNIKEMMHSWKKDGCIGPVCTADARKAAQVATAAAYSNQRKSK